MNPTMPLVSIVIPVYNVFPYLQEALDSVVHQTYANLDIIIVDDGSSDGSGEVCDRYKADPRVRVIHQENRGLSGARNAGLDLMIGEYVAFLDPDDAFHQDMIERLLETMICGEADMATCGYDVYKTENPMKNARRTEGIIPRRETMLTAEEIFNALFDGKYTMCVWNKVYKRKIWEHLRFQEGKIYEDILAVPDVVEQCERIAVVPQALVYRRRRKGSITQTITVENIMQRMEASAVLWDSLASRMPAKSDICRENNIRAQIMGWAELEKYGAPALVTDELKNEILKNAETGTSYQSMKLRVAWWLFRYCPRMLLPARACFRKLRRFFGKERKIVA